MSFDKVAVIINEFKTRHFDTLIVLNTSYNALILSSHKQIMKIVVWSYRVYGGVTPLFSSDTAAYRITLSQKLQNIKRIIKKTTANINTI